MNDEYAKKLEEFARNIFKAEPQLVYRDAVFRPPLNMQSSLGVGFNYWRGWSAAILPAPRGNISLAPTISFAADIWCGGISNSATLRSASVSMKDNVGDEVHFILSWFAHIVQSPGAQPECQLVFRGFAPELVLPLLQFLGRSVIGAQYFMEVPTSTRGIEIRKDCLLAVIDSCPLKEFESVMQEVRGLWKAPIAHGKLSPAEKLAKQRGMMPRDQKTIDDNEGQSRCHPLVRAAVCMTLPAQRVPIEQSRRRFSVIDYSQTATDAVELRLRAMQETIANPDAAAAMFNYLARLSPLMLHWT